MNPWAAGHPAYNSQHEEVTNVVLSAAHWQLHPSATYRLLCEIHRRISEYNRCFTPLELVLWSSTTLDMHLTEERAEEWLLPFNSHLVH